MIRHRATLIVIVLILEANLHADDRLAFVRVSPRIHTTSSFLAGGRIFRSA